MKKHLALACAVGLLSHGAFALTTVPVDYPGALNGNQANDSSNVAKLVAVYQNDVVLLANPNENFSKEIQGVSSNEGTVNQLRRLASANGAMTVKSLSDAVAAMVAQNPSSAPTIVASALELLKQLPGGASVENRVAVGRAALGAIPMSAANVELMAMVIGVASEGIPVGDVATVVRALREVPIADASRSEQARLALTLDEALVEEGIISPFAGAPEFVALAKNYQADASMVSFEDTGAMAISPVYSPGAAGSAGAPGNPSPQIGEPTPTPAPPPAPTPTPFPAS